MASLSSVTQWDDSADVVILGFGLAGAVTAITAHDIDPEADVLILEKNPARYAGGNSRASGQTLWCPHDVEATVIYQQAMNQPNPVPEELLRVWAEEMNQQEPWIEQMAAEAGMTYVRHGSEPNREEAGLGVIVEFPDLPGAQQAVTYNSTIHPNPSGVWNTFRIHVERRPRIRIQFESRALDLVQDPDTLEVFGVVLEAGGERRFIQARRAVVLCTGSFEGNLGMQKDFWGAEEIYPIGNPANTGDGIRMLQKAGAQLWHMRNFNQTGGLWPSMKVPGYQAVFFRNIRMPATSWIDIGADGERFYDEGFFYGPTHYRETRHGKWVDVQMDRVLPVHMIFDEATRLAQPLTTSWMGWNAVVEGYQWSPDNAAEIDRGWIVKADTLEELATRIGRDPQRLRRTVDRYNQAARTGIDPDFGREPARMSPIEQGPFYAVALVPGIVAHTGGGKRDARSRVLDWEDRPIPRLYEAGELGSTLANIYQNGSFLTECMVFGKIAGRNAVAEVPVTDRVRVRA